MPLKANRGSAESAGNCKGGLNVKDLRRAVWPEYDVSDESIRTHIHKLRKAFASRYRLVEGIDRSHWSILEIARLGNSPHRFEGLAELNALSTRVNALSTRATRTRKRDFLSVTPSSTDGDHAMKQASGGKYVGRDPAIPFKRPFSGRDP